MTLYDRARLTNTREQLRAFGGLNETYACSEAEYSAGINFSSRNFPALSTRKPRRRLREMKDLNGMYHLNGLLAACGTDLVYIPDDPGQETVTYSKKVTNDRKSMVGIGTKILIFPDKLSFDTAQGTLSSLGAVWDGTGRQLRFEPCDGEGKVYRAKSFGKTEPTDPADGELFWKVEDTAHPWRYGGTLEVYSAAAGSWTAIPLEYCRIFGAELDLTFARWDTVHLSGCAAKEMGQWDSLEGDLILYDTGTNWLRVKAASGGEYFFGSLTQTGNKAVWTSGDGTVTREVDLSAPAVLERQIPDLDFVTECDNRVWGCNSKQNVIYACKLGDPTNWFSYRGIAADSYAVTVGSDGAFTGAATCMGYALFFKENTLHKVYGSKPSDFQLTSLRCRGVANNAGRSLCVLNETLYYLSSDGVMEWDGSIPAKVSAVLESSRLANVQCAVGGALDGRYYLYIRRRAQSTSRQEQRLLVYDTERRLWHEEDVTSCDMTSTGGQLYLWDGQALWAADPSREPDWQNTEGVEKDIPFELVTGDMGMEAAEQRYLSRLTLRTDAESPTTVEVAVSYDGGGWEKLADLAVRDRCRCYDLPFVPRRYGTLRLRLRGTGQLTLRSVAKTLAAAKGGIVEQEV